MNYEPLAKLIEPYADGPFDKLPDGLRERVGKAFRAPWNELSPVQRRCYARDLDLPNDPAMKPENRYWRDLESEIWTMELKITEWEKKGSLIPSEALIWEVKRAALGDRLSKLEGLRKLVPFLVKDWKALTDAALVEVVNNIIQTDGISGGAKLDSIVANTAAAQDTATPATAGDVGASGDVKVGTTTATNKGNKSQKTKAFEAEVLRLIQKFWDAKTT